jgi:hypothetical protein
MVPTPGAAVRVDRLRALNVPEPVAVELGADGRPAAVRRLGGQAVSDCTVEAVLENWRIDDEWWRQPIARRYYEVMLNGGGHVVLFEDFVTGGWFVQKP